MLEALKQEVYRANLDLVKYNLVIFTWGNVSAKSGDYIVIKPSGMDYNLMKPEDMVVLDLKGNIIEGKNNPSSDTLTHIELYKAFPKIEGICHTHSNFATSFAQAGKSIECLGTTHADYFNGSIPCTRDLTKEEIEKDYEKNTGRVIIETFQDKKYNELQSVLVKSHGVFTWGNNPFQAVENAVIVEELAKMNYQTIMLNPNVSRINSNYLNKHYYRKHGINHYYGQST